MSKHLVISFFFSICPERFTALSILVENLFPATESRSRYFTAFTTDTYGNKVFEGGLFYEVCKDIRAEYRTIWKLIGRRRPGKNFIFIDGKIIFF